MGIQYYPAFLDLRGRRVVVIGGGEVATAKVDGLLPCGPEPLVVIAPVASAFIQERAQAGRLEWRARPYRDGDVAGATIAIAATDDRATNARVAAEARGWGVLALAVDDPDNCDFIGPAVVKRGDVVIAVSTGGRSPAMARWLREQLEATTPSHWGDLLDVAAEARQRLKAVGSRVAPDHWQAALDERVESAARSGDRDGAVELLLERLRVAVGV